MMMSCRSTEEILCRLKEEHGAELQAKRKMETRLRNLESQIASDNEDLEEMKRKLESEVQENKKVTIRRERGEGEERGEGGREEGDRGREGGRGEGRERGERVVM